METLQDNLDRITRVVLVQRRTERQGWTSRNHHRRARLVAYCAGPLVEPRAVGITLRRQGLAIRQRRL
jgi:hypothetical protein